MAGLDMSREYLVLVITNDEGEVTGLRVRDDPQLGKVVRLFTDKEKLDRWHEQSDEKGRFIDLLEQQQISSEDLNLEYYSRITVSELSPILEAYDVDYLQVDPLTPGGWNRLYPLPHKEGSGS